MAEQARCSPAWSLCLPLLSATSLLSAPPGNHLPTALIAATLFSIAQFVLPGSRFRKDHYFSPVNLALLLFLLKLVVVPALIAMTGAETDLPMSLPSWKAMDWTLYVDIMAFFAFSLGLEAISRRRTKAVFMEAALSQTPSSVYLVVFAGVGLIGFVAVFGDLSRLTDYFVKGSIVTELQNDAAGTLRGLIGTVFRPFLAFALAAWWARVVDRDRDRPQVWKSSATGLIAALGITLANLTFSFNRAAFVFPVLCLAAVYSTRVRRIPAALAGIVLVVAIPALLAVSAYRSNLMMGADATVEDALENSMRNVSQQLQIYSGGPQLTGNFYESIGWGDHLYLGSTLVNSLLSPIPVLGMRSRETNGPAVYNYALYGVRDIEDQIIPLDVELFANFHVPGVLFGFAALGMFVGRAEQWFAAARSAFGGFAVQYVSVWAAMLTVWSLSVYVQICWAFFGPIYVYLASMQARRWLHNANRGRLISLFESGA